MKANKLLGISLLASTLLGCAGFLQEFEPPSNWPELEGTEESFQAAFADAAGLDPIEGIWISSETQTWRTVGSGVSGSTATRQNGYRMVIIKNSSKPGYEYCGAILESQNPYWSKGRIKAYFRKTSLEGTYEGLAYLGRYQEESDLFVMESSGLMTLTRVFCNQGDSNGEILSTTVFLRVYPLLPEADDRPLPCLQ